MNKYREYLKENSFTRFSFFIVFTATLLYITYFIVSNYKDIFTTAFDILGSIINTLSPLWIGLILAYLMNPLVEKIYTIITTKIKSSNNINNKSNKSRFFSIFASYLLIILAIIALLYGFAALILGQLVFESLEDLINKLVIWISSYGNEFTIWVKDLPSGIFSTHVEDVLNILFKWINSNLSSVAIISHITNVSGMIINFGIGFMISIYLLADKEFFISLWNRFIYLIAPKNSSLINRNLHEINGILSNFVRGVLLDAFIVGILSSVGLTLLGLKFSVFIGIFAGICNIIPYFGPFLGMIPAFAVGALTDSFLTGIFAVAILLLVQQIDSNIIYPRVVGSSTGLKPLFVLLAVTLGGSYGGIPAMIIAVPFAGIVQLYVLKWATYRENKIKSRKIDSTIE
jgi:predicted PurR-regulated permease PerM